MAFIEVTRCDGEKFLVNTGHIKIIKRNNGGSVRMLIDGGRYGDADMDVTEDYKTVKKLIEKAEAPAVEIVAENPKKETSNTGKHGQCGKCGRHMEKVGNHAYCTECSKKRSEPPRAKVRWYRADDCCGYVCPVCLEVQNDYSSNESSSMRFCPNCGAEMIDGK